MAIKLQKSTIERDNKNLNRRFTILYKNEMSSTFGIFERLRVTNK